MTVVGGLLALPSRRAAPPVREVRGDPFALGADAVLVPLGPWPSCLGPVPGGREGALAETRAHALRPGQAVATDGLGTGVAHLIHVAPPSPGARAGSYAAGLYLAKAVGARTVCVPVLWPELPGDDASRRADAASAARSLGCPRIVLADAS